MSFVNLRETLDTQSVILSREISKLEDVYSLIDIVEEKLRLDISLTLLLLETDCEAKSELLDIKDEVKEPEKVFHDEELKEIPESDVQSDESDEDVNDPNFNPEYEEIIPKTETKVTKTKLKTKKVDKDSTGESLCNECGKTYRQLARHKRLMHSKKDKKKYLCNECGKMYNDLRHLKRHKRVIHLKEKQTHTCPICKKEESYKYYSDFWKHKQICEAKLPENAERYVCSICGEKFGTWYNWKNHHYVCSGVKPKRSLKSKPTVYKCDFENCDYITRQKIKFKNHVNIVHLNLPEIRDHFCESCGKSFKEPRQLKNHVNAVHLNKRDHTCTTCGNCFKSNEMLKRHVKIHSDVYSYVCPFLHCGKKFKQSATLYRHKLSCQFNLHKNK